MIFYDIFLHKYYNCICTLFQRKFLKYTQTHFWKTTKAAEQIIQFLGKEDTCYEEKSGGL